MRRYDTSLQPGLALPATSKFLLVAQELQSVIEPEPLEYLSDRRHPRRLQSISISIQPLDDDFQPDGELFWVVSRDISSRGIGLICPDSIAHGYVRIGLMNELATIIGNVRHNTSIGHNYPMFLVGIEFAGGNERD